LGHSGHNVVGEETGDGPLTPIAAKGEGPSDGAGVFSGDGAGVFSGDGVGVFSGDELGDETGDELGDETGDELGDETGVVPFEQAHKVLDSNS
jgi:hypothetical protein